MANKMISEVVPGAAGTIIDIAGVPVIIWQKFRCEFEQVPTSTLFGRNQKKMRKYLNEYLRSLEDGEFYELFILWINIKSKSKEFYVVVVARDTEPPPEGGTAPPQPPPGSPGDMNG